MWYKILPTSKSEMKLTSQFYTLDLTGNQKIKLSSISYNQQLTIASILILSQDHNLFATTEAITQE